MSEAKTLHISVVVEIIARLPIKSIGRCRCVCKTWNSLVEEPFFIHKQLLINHRAVADETNRAAKSYDIIYYNHEACRFYGWNTTTSNLTNSTSSWLKQKLLGNPAGPPTKRRSPDINVPRSPKLFLECSCNGLMCLSYSGKIILWNPSIEKYMYISDDNYNNKPSCMYLGFGFVPQTSDYKVIILQKNHRQGLPDVKIYSLNNNTWKTKSWAVGDTSSNSRTSYEIVPQRFLFHTSKGNRHWIATKTTTMTDYYYGLEEPTDQKVVAAETVEVVLAFDMMEEKFHEIAIPKENKQYRSFQVTDYRDTFALIVGLYPKLWEIWVMKDYKSWIKLYSLGSRHDAPRDIMDNGQVIVHSPDGALLIVYDPTTGNQRKFDVCPTFHRVVVYHGSLAMLNIQVESKLRTLLKRFLFDDW